MSPTLVYLVLHCPGAARWRGKITPCQGVTVVAAKTLGH